MDSLNSAQRKAVEYSEGPLLVVAGPGSGKTRVIIHRIAYLVEALGIPPWRIATVTFTNRAAREVKGRLERILGPRSLQLMAGTFHSMCARILREDGAPIGVPTGFVIFDDTDQMAVIKEAMELAKVDPKRFPPRTFLAAISSAKSQLVGHDSYLTYFDGYYHELIQRVYVFYQGLLDRSQALDFDDLLSKTVRLFDQSPGTLERYQDRFMHLMVDEFQDTNVAQYRIARDLAGKHLNLCVVGDPDQSIYSWRNADLRNILSFQKDYPNAEIITLSQNYRSTKMIIGAAQSVISNNTTRIQQELWTDNQEGQRIAVAEAHDEVEEANEILNEVGKLINSGSYSLSDIAVTYRVNAQSRALEEACLHHGVPYKLVGGTRFYQRREVKDVMGYLRLLQNPNDEVALNRVINVPPRGIGKGTVASLTNWAQSLGIPNYQAILTIVEDESEGIKEVPLKSGQAQRLGEFGNLIGSLRDTMVECDLLELIDAVIRDTGYRNFLLDSGEPDLEDRLENLQELRGVASDFREVPINEALQQFLETASLVSQQDSLSEDALEQLTLITLHQIKGLEYPVVFITGLEETVLPHIRSLDDPEQLEEERRLVYVGMTRAKERLYLFRAFRRRLAGMGQVRLPSRYLYDIPSEFMSNLERRSTMVDKPNGSYERVYSAAQVADAIPDKAPFNPGDKVIHEQFGIGIVLSCEARSNDYEIRVFFDQSQHDKRLLFSLAKMTRLGLDE